MTVEVHGLRAYTHTVDAQTYLLERLLRVEVSPLGIVSHEFFLAELVEVLHDGIIRRVQLAVVGAVSNAESGIELGEQYLDGIHLGIGEILVGTEEVLQEGNMLTESCDLLEGIRCGGIDVLHTVCPNLRFQRIDGVSTGHEVDITAA